MGQNVTEKASLQGLRGANVGTLETVVTYRTNTMFRRTGGPDKFHYSIEKHNKRMQRNGGMCITDNVIKKVKKWRDRKIWPSWLCILVFEEPRFYLGGEIGGKNCFFHYSIFLFYFGISGSWQTWEQKQREEARRKETFEILMGMRGWPK